MIFKILKWSETCYWGWYALCVNNEAKKSTVGNPTEFPLQHFRQHCSTEHFLFTPDITVITVTVINLQVWLTGLTPTRRQARRKFSTFLRHFASVNFGCKKTH